jgi:hypothetical protein
MLGGGDGDRASCPLRRPSLVSVSQPFGVHGSGRFLLAWLLSLSQGEWLPLGARTLRLLGRGIELLVRCYQVSSPHVGRC